LAVALEADPALRRIAIVPAYDEERTIGRVIDEIRTVEPGFDIVVDDGPSDRTAIVAQRVASTA
jgi:glycosyltransferase involved in cell wall biosynthesis